jgi:hypothetical protein
LRVESEPYSKGWRIVKELDGYGLDRTMNQAGWTCFYMANEISASAVALNGEKSLFKAVQQILTKLKLERFNSLEITQVATKRFLGLPHTTVSAHARHIQESMFLFDWMKKSRNTTSACLECRNSIAGCAVDLIGWGTDGRPNRLERACQWASRQGSKGESK